MFSSPEKSKITGEVPQPEVGRAESASQQILWWKLLGDVMDADEIASTAIEHPNVVLVLQASPDLFYSSKTAAIVD